jgi:RNA polymerase sigma-70 factor (ECF subfamily)
MVSQPDCQICGTNSALEMLWNQFHDRLYRFISSRLSNEQDTEDIIQEVFLRIHTHLETVRDVNKLESWIYQIARNSIIDYYRRQRKLVDLEPDLPVEDEYPEEDLAESLAPSIREVVQALPEPYRQALLLTEYQGLSQQEMADALGISLSGAKSRVQRARQKVKDILLACCHFEFDLRGTLYEVRLRCCCCEGEAMPI